MQSFDRRCLLIAAVSLDGIIGRKGEIPWKLPGDMAHFKKTTMGCTLIMGRETYESLPAKELPGRNIIVLSRHKYYHLKTVRTAQSWEEAETLLNEVSSPLEPIVIAGGGRVYGAVSFDNEHVPKIFLPREVIITWVQKVVNKKNKDTLFGRYTEFGFSVNPMKWKSVSEESYFENETLYRICRYQLRSC